MKQPITIRKFQLRDLETVIRLASLSFADPALQEGGTPEALSQRLHSLTRGGLWPMRVLTRLLGYRLEMLVAEANGDLAGFVMVTGWKQLNMNTLMVHPQYRRRGVGIALVEEAARLAHAWEYSFITAEVLATNHASAQLCQKFGFKVYDTYLHYETALPLNRPAEQSAGNRLMLRATAASDRAAFTELERRLVSPGIIQARGSAARFYFPSIYRRLFDQRLGKQSQAWVVEGDGRQVGFQYLHSSLGNPEGTLARPLLPDQHLCFLPSILETAADWFVQLGKTTLRIESPAESRDLLETLSTWDWQPSVGWLCLVKWL